MSHAHLDPSDILTCPSDLCCHGECHCAPSRAGPALASVTRTLRVAVVRLFGAGSAASGR